MAWEQPGFSASYKAGADLSSSQYKFVKLDSSGNVIVCAATTDKPIGVLQNNPVSGGEALVMHSGVTKMLAGGAQTIDDLIGTAADGRSAAYVPGTDTTKYIVGRALAAAGGAGEYFSMIFSCLSLARGA